MIKKEDMQFLKNTVRVWNHLTDKEQNMLMENSLYKFFEKNENIYSKENDCLGTLIIKKGALRAYILSPEGREVTLYHLYVNDICIFTATCLIKNITFEVFVDASEATECLFIPSALFESLQKENIYLENFALKLATERFNEIMRTFESIIFLPFDQRLITFLKEETGRIQSNNIYLTHEETAKKLGTAREVVSRSLKKFEKEGLLRLARGKITIIDMNKLNNYIF